MSENTSNNNDTVSGDPTDEPTVAVEGESAAHDAGAEATDNVDQAIADVPSEAGVVPPA